MSGIAAVPSNLILLDTQIVAGVVSVQNTTNLTSAFSKYIWEISNLIFATANGDALLTVQQGGSFIAAGYNWASSRSSGGAPAGSGAIAGANFNVTQAGAAINGSPSLVRVELYNPAAAANLLCLWTSLQNNSTTTIERTDGGGVINSVLATTGIKLAASAGNLSCTAKLYGIT